MTSLTNKDLTQAIKSHLTYCQKARRLSRHTCSAYKTDLTVFQALVGAGSVDCQTIVTGLEKIIGNPVHKPATIGRRVVAIHGFLNWWDQSLVHEVFSRIKFRMKKPKRLPRTIPRSELNLILAGARDANPN
jgi:site-specific recombinase XerD